MYRHQLHWTIWVLGLCMGWAACSEKDSSTELPRPLPTVAKALQPCGSPLLLSVRGNTSEVGVFEIMNDSSRLQLGFAPSSRYRLVELRAHLGVAEDLPLRPGGTPDAARFNVVERPAPGSSGRWEKAYPLSRWPECMKIAVRIKLEDLESPQKATVKGWAMGPNTDSRFTFDYCLRSCEADHRCTSAGTGDFQSAPPLVWTDAETPLAQQLGADFQTAFPEGLELGCAVKYHLDNASDVQGLLARERRLLEFGDGSTPTAASDHLAREICALELTLGYDKTFPDFCRSEAPFGELQVTSGTFTGWSVAELLSEANTYIGACASNYSPQQLTEVLAAVNENYSEGTIDRQLLACPQ